MRESRERAKRANYGLLFKAAMVFLMVIVAPSLDLATLPLGTGTMKEGDGGILRESIRRAIFSG